VAVAARAGRRRRLRDTDHRPLQHRPSLVGSIAAPWPTITLAAILWGVTGFSGIVYAVIVARRMRRQAVYQPEFEDWLFHGGLPLAAYAVLALSALAVPAYTVEALFGVGTATLLLLFIGIHNAWDAVAWHVFVNLRNENGEQRHDETSGKER
jgi:hypothetical protein